MRAQRTNTVYIIRLRTPVVFRCAARSSDRVCFIARILHAPTDGVLKIVKSVSPRTLKIRSRSYLCRGAGHGAEGGKKKEQEKMHTYRKFRLPTRCARCPFDFYVHYVVRRGTHAPRTREYTHARPLRRGRIRRRARLVHLISFFSVAARPVRYAVTAVHGDRVRFLAPGPTVGRRARGNAPRRRLQTEHSTLFTRRSWAVVKKRDAEKSHGENTSSHKYTEKKPRVRFKLF